MQHNWMPKPSCRQMNSRFFRSCSDSKSFLSRRLGSSDSRSPIQEGTFLHFLFPFLYVQSLGQHVLELNKINSKFQKPQQKHYLPERTVRTVLSRSSFHPLLHLFLPKQTSKNPGGQQGTNKRTQTASKTSPVNKNSSQSLAPCIYLHIYLPMFGYDF